MTRAGEITPRKLITPKYTYHPPWNPNHPQITPSPPLTPGIIHSPLESPLASRLGSTDLEAGRMNDSHTTSQWQHTNNYSYNSKLSATIETRRISADNRTKRITERDSFRWFRWRIVRVADGRQLNIYNIETHSTLYYPPNRETICILAQHPGQYEKAWIHYQVIPHSSDSQDEYLYIQWILKASTCPYRNIANVAISILNWIFITDLFHGESSLSPALVTSSVRHQTAVSSPGDNTTQRGGRGWCGRSERGSANDSIAISWL